MYAILLQECHDAVDGAEVLGHHVSTIDAEVEGDLHVGDECHNVVRVEHACFDEVLVANMEITFNFRIDGTDVVPENFGSVDSIVTLLEKYGVH